MKDPHDVVKALLRTEKGSVLNPLNKYLFSVDPRANKIEIKNAVQDIYKVKVTGVNTLVIKGKPRRVRYEIGKTANWKKAVVTLKEGDKIDIA